MKFLEKDLEQIIYETNYIDLLKSGLYVWGKKKRQLKIGRYGIADLVYIDRPRYHTGIGSMVKGTIHVIELKQNKISVSAFLQAVRYVRGIQRFLSIRKPNLSDCFDFNIILIGSELDLESSLCYLPELFFPECSERQIDETARTSVQLYTYEYEFTGLKFIEHSKYKLSHEGL